MRRALVLAGADDAPRGINPRVGCVLVRDGRVIGEGHHRGAGTLHAEIDALLSSSESPRGATAVVTLEPCAHVGRTGPCVDALIEAGVSRVVFAQSDPTPEATGGQRRLRDAGVEVVAGVLESEVADLNSDWTLMKRRGRPHLTLKIASSLDGKVDSTDSERLLLTGAQADAAVQLLRSQVDAIAVGTGTVIADDPRLTVRHHGAGVRPIRVILGTSPIPSGARVIDAAAETVIIAERDPRMALGRLAEMGIQRLLLEGGPTVAGAYLAAGVVDEVRWYVSPLLVGTGVQALAGLDSQVALDVIAVDLVGEDVCITGVPVTDMR
jgi:diaminohydroxyphosphoribosylaminopyrimidine deaminase/5-amino-6-(5-phosphoribosylamino)uracil reductase